jgi:hypothetical protein
MGSPGQPKVILTPPAIACAGIIAERSFGSRPERRVPRQSPLSRSTIDIALACPAAKPLTVLPRAAPRWDKAVSHPFLGAQAATDPPSPTPRWPFPPASVAPSPRGMSLTVVAGCSGALDKEPSEIAGFTPTLSVGRSTDESPTRFSRSHFCRSRNAPSAISGAVDSLARQRTKPGIE